MIATSPKTPVAYRTYRVKKQRASNHSFTHAETITPYDEHTNTKHLDAKHAPHNYCRVRQALTNLLQLKPISCTKEEKRTLNTLGCDASQSVLELSKFNLDAKTTEVYHSRNNPFSETTTPLFQQPTITCFNFSPTTNIVYDIHVDSVSPTSRVQILL